MDKTQRDKTLAESVARLEKAFGKGIVQYLGRGGPLENVEVVPTGSLNLDIILGIGGWPRGRIVEIYGPESSGKTSLALHAIAEAQRADGKCAFVDAEHALDVAYARRIGVSTDDLLVSQPDYGEQALEVVDELIRSQAISVVVVDSVAALVPKAEIEGDMGDAQMGLQARLMSQAMRKLTATASRAGTLIIFINQTRQKIGVFYGNPETTTGGNALKFYASVRVEIRRVGAIKEGDRLTGNRTRVKVVKNKCAPPFREAEFDILYGVGISRVGEILDAADALSIVERAGAWYSLRGEKLGQGRAAVSARLGENPALLRDLEGQVRARYDALRATARPTSDEPAGTEAAR